MILCNHCLQELSKELGNIELEVLIMLGMSYTQIEGLNRVQLLNKSNGLSSHKINSATIILDALGLITHVYSGKIAVYYITSAGSTVLDILNLHDDKVLED